MPKPLQHGRKRTRVMIALAGCLALLIVAGVTTATVLARRGPVALEAAGSVGDHPFVATPGVDVASPAGTPAAGGEVDGDAVGLYLDAGPRSCDASRISAALRADPARAGAWAEPADVGAGDVDTYVGGLTPLVLGSDTSVTEHDFRGGRAVPYGAVLQRGTAVLVTSRGVPVVKCGSGNPLTEPEAGVPSAHTGSAWPGFSPANTATISGAPESVAAFGVVDPVTGQPATRPVRGSDGSLAASRPGGQWAVDPIDRKAPYQVKALDIRDFFEGCKSGTLRNCPEVEFEFWDQEKNEFVKQKLNFSDLPNCEKPDQGVELCIYLHDIIYDKGFVEVDRSGNLIRSGGNLVPCDPEGVKPCGLPPGTKVIVRFSAPLSEDEAIARSNVDPDTLKPGQRINPGSGDPVIADGTVATPSGPRNPGASETGRAQRYSGSAGARSTTTKSSPPKRQARIATPGQDATGSATTDPSSPNSPSVTQPDDGAGDNANVAGQNGGGGDGAGSGNGAGEESTVNGGATSGETGAGETGGGDITTGD